MSAQHTPGRLARRDTPDYAELFATDPRAGSITAQIAMVARVEDADRIALCWNAHDDLVEALNLARPYVQAASVNYYDGTGGPSVRVRAARTLAAIDAAIAKAPGEAAQQPGGAA